MHQWHIKSIDENLIKESVNEAIEYQKMGKEIKLTRNNTLSIPSELKNSFDENPDLLKSFNEFSLAQQREFAEYIAETKRENTKPQRLEKIIPMILRNEGLNDKYKQ